MSSGANYKTELILGSQMYEMYRLTGRIKKHLNENYWLIGISMIWLLYGTNLANLEGWSPGRVGQLVTKEGKGFLHPWGEANKTTSILEFGSW